MFQNFMCKVNLFCFFLLILFIGCNNTSNNNEESKQVSNKMGNTSGKEIKTILFFGNSLTAGYGLDDVADAFPSVIQKKVDSLKLPYKVINAGLSGETTAAGKNRIEWLLKQRVDVFVLELGANDGLRGIPVDETAKNLQVIVDKVKKRYPNAKQVLLGMEVPPNMGSEYAVEFREVFQKIAKRNNMALVPFMLNGVAGNPELNLKDGIHPTPEGYKIVAENIWAVLKDLL